MLSCAAAVWSNPAGDIEGIRPPGGEACKRRIQPGNFGAGRRGGELQSRQREVGCRWEWRESRGRAGEWRWESGQPDERRSPAPSQVLNPESERAGEPSLNGRDARACWLARRCPYPTRSGQIRFEGSSRNREDGPFDVRKDALSSVHSRAVLRVGMRRGDRRTRGRWRGFENLQHIADLVFEPLQQL
jgi:hypothetical protein